MTTTIQAIPTEHNGIRYDSQLEARWAVFFDTLEIPFKTGERESFFVPALNTITHPTYPPRTRHYTPDFVLTRSDLAVEVKGTMANVSGSLLAHYLYYAASRSEGLLFLFPIPTPRPVKGRRRICCKGKYKTLWHPVIHSGCGIEGGEVGTKDLRGRWMAFYPGGGIPSSTEMILSHPGSLRVFLESHQREPRFTDEHAPDKVIDAYFQARQYDF